MNEPSPNKNYLGRLAIVLHAHLPYVRKHEKNSLEEDWLFQAMIECYIPLLQVMETSKKQDISNTKLTLSLSPTLLSLLQNKQIQKKFSSWIKTRIDFLVNLPQKEQAAAAGLCGEHPVWKGHRVGGGEPARGSRRARRSATGWRPARRRTRMTMRTRTRRSR